MRQVLGPSALGRPRGIGWRGRWEGGSGWGIHVYPRLIHVNVWQKPLQYCKVISLQLIKKINKKKKKRQRNQRSNCQDLLTRDQKQDDSRKHLLLLIDYDKAFVWITTNCGKFVKIWEYQTTLPAS